MRRTRAAVLTALLSMAGTEALRAQQTELVLAGTGALVDMRSQEADGRTRYQGFAVGLAGRIGVGPAFLDLGYAQGIARRDGNDDIGRRHAEAIARLGLAPFTFLEIAGAARGRAWSTEREPPPLSPTRTGGGTREERWLLFEVGGRLAAPLYRVNGGVIRAFADGHVVLGGSTGDAAGFEQGRGGSAGLEVRLTNPAIGVSFAYGIAENRFDFGRTETVESVTLAVGIRLGRPRESVTAVFRSR